MRVKVLKAQTIIPDGLYIHRAADKQLVSIINDMGRPGYILVARQMGKTNLLLNVKRELESNEILFTYIDLSSPFPSSRDCFRYIINKTIETHKDYFSKVQYTIEQKRQKYLLPSHIEHGHELKMLLNLCPGKLVIILDEIDALTKATFSDEIFAQIRSIYFERNDFVEYTKLTYILSGVIEPRDIIKNPIISPFNIGQEIFLSDFTYEEYRSFISMSNLDVLGGDIVERIYYWAAGHPRITWDICSAIEDVLIEGKAISTDIVDRLVDQLYLIKHDKAPIDNIREIIEHDNVLRTALVQLVTDNNVVLSDDVKRRLYLAGIINIYSSEVRIKNRIIEKALSGNWLKDIEKNKKGALKVASDLYHEYRYNEAVVLFEEYIKENGSDKFDSIANYELGMSYYHNGKYTAAIEYLLKTKWNKDEVQLMYIETEYTIALCYYYIADYNNSIKLFTEISECADNNKFYYQALINLAGSYFNKNVNEYKNTIIDINTKVLSGLNDATKLIEIKDPDNLKTVAHYNLGKIYQTTNDRDLANKHYANALNYAKEDRKISILIEIYRMENDSNVRVTLLNEMINLIKKSELKVKDNIEDNLVFNSEQMESVLAETYINIGSRFNELLEYCVKSGSAIHTAEDYLYDLGFYFIQIKDYQSAEKVFSELVEKIELLKIGTDKLVIIYKYLSLIVKSDKRRYYFNRYFALITGTKPSQLDMLDIDILIQRTSECIDNENGKVALKYINMINKYSNVIDDSLKANLIIVKYLEMRVARLEKKKKVMFDKAVEVVDMLSKYKIVKEKLLVSEKELNLIRNDARGIINEYKSNQTEVRQTNKINRNDVIKVQYKDGMIVTKKYKYLENDLKQGTCKIYQQ